MTASSESGTPPTAKTRFPEKPVFNGFDEMLRAGLTMGADVDIGSMYNFMAEKYLVLY